MLVKLIKEHWKWFIIRHIAIINSYFIHWIQIEQCLLFNHLLFHSVRSVKTTKFNYRIWISMRTRRSLVKYCLCLFLSFKWLSVDWSIVIERNINSNLSLRQTIKATEEKGLIFMCIWYSKWIWLEISRLNFNATFSTFILQYKFKFVIKYVESVVHFEWFCCCWCCCCFLPGQFVEQNQHKNG